MYNHRGKRKKNGREYSVDFYSCSTYTLTFERETQMCSSHTVSTKALNALILETIRTTASYAIQNKEEFIQKVRSISQVRQQEAAKELKRKVAKERKRSAELDVLIKSCMKPMPWANWRKNGSSCCVPNMRRNRPSWNSCLPPSRHSWTNFTRIQTVPATFWRWHRNIRISPS